MFLGGEGEGDFVSSPVAAGGGNSPDAKFLGEDTSNQPIGAGYGRKNQKSIAGREEVQDWEDHDEDSESDIDPFEGVDIDEMRGNMGELVSGEHGMTLHWQRKELDAVPDQVSGEHGMTLHWQRKDLDAVLDQANVIKTLPIELAQFTKLETLSVSQNRGY
ncbi:hypothetical protein T484DRAFT_1906613 [Baffinella frigidus]|nr:hypothetical protein T484DRAFT_1906613 [Cryptophyta sp. CCMP2293]